MKFLAVLATQIVAPVVVLAVILKWLQFGTVFMSWPEAFIGAAALSLLFGLAYRLTPWRNR